jgi:hypothetical protein
MRYRVYGQTTVNVVTEVIAESANDALEMALHELNGLIPYVGNGGTDKLIGVDGYNESVSADGEIEWLTAEELGFDEDEGADEK